MTHQIIVKHGTRGAALIIHIRREPRRQVAQIPAVKPSSVNVVFGSSLKFHHDVTVYNHVLLFLFDVNIFTVYHLYICKMFVKNMIFFSLI